MVVSFSVNGPSPCKTVLGGAPAQADKELSGSVVSKVLENMDVHGRLTLDQFLAIVEVCATPRT